MAGEKVSDISNNFLEQIESEQHPNNTKVGTEKLGVLPESRIDFDFSATEVPLRTILWLLCDFQIRFLFALPLSNPLAPLQGLKWATQTDPATGAKIEVEVGDTALPAGLAGQGELSVADLYDAVKWSLMRIWTGTDMDELAHQLAFEAGFSLLGAQGRYFSVKLIVDERERKQGEVLDVDAWNKGVVGGDIVKPIQVL